MAELRIQTEDDLKDQTAPSIVAKRIGIAKGKFRAPDDLDRDNEEIAELFYSAANLAHLARVVEDLKNGRNCAPHELLEE